MWSVEQALSVICPSPSRRKTARAVTSALGIRCTSFHSLPTCVADTSLARSAERRKTAHDEQDQMLLRMATTSRIFARADASFAGTRFKTGCAVVKLLKVPVGWASSRQLDEQGLGGTKCAGECAGIRQRGAGVSRLYNVLRDAGAGPSSNLAVQTCPVVESVSLSFGRVDGAISDTTNLSWNRAGDTFLFDGAGAGLELAGRHSSSERDTACERGVARLSDRKRR